MENIEAEVTKLIQEVEENKKKQEELIRENEKLKSENTHFKINEAKYAATFEENARLKHEQSQQSTNALSEKDLADVMINAKVVANEMIQKAKSEALEFEQQKQAALTSLRHEGKNLKDEILNIKSKIDRDLYLWVEDLENFLSENPKQQNK